MSLKIDARDLLKKIYWCIAPLKSKRRRWTYRLIQYVIIHYRSLNEQYRKWIRRFDILTENHLGEVERFGQSMDNRPSFSVIMPVFNPSLTFLDEAIHSVRGQIYPNWELCIADDASTLPGIRELILQHASNDSRIRYVFREQNGHISAASNSALELATGDYAVLLDHDDILHPLALYEAAKVIQQFPDAEVIYSDEDKITERGQRFMPYFKSDFDPEMLLTRNVISHLGIYKLDTIRKVGSFRLGLEGSQDYDLLLRVLEQVHPDQIYHIPKVLYHWRSTSQSVADNINIKPYAITAGERAINDHLAREAIDGRVTYNPEFTAYEIEYALPKPCPRVELIIIGEPNSIYNEDIRVLLNNTRYESFKVTIGVKGEVIGLGLEELNDYPQVSIQRISPEIGSILVLNEIVLGSDADFIGVLDKDLGGFSPGWLEMLMGLAIQKGVGAVGPKLLNKRGRVYSNGIILGAGATATHLFRGKPADYLGYFGWGQLQRGFSAISGKCIIFGRDDFLVAAGLDTQFRTEEAAWIDFCLRLKQCGLRNVVYPSLRLRLATKQFDERWEVASPSDENRLLEKWGGIISHDPAFNPNLTLQRGKIRINLDQEMV